MRYDEPTGWYTPDFFSGGPGSYIRRSAVIELALSHHYGRRTVIQAGAHIGVWPKKLAKFYKQVVCFEPMLENWDCLIHNVTELNVMCSQEALGDKNGVGEINFRRTKSSGGHHIATRTNQPRQTVVMRALDSLGIPDVDAIFLDIEGYEIPALKGAKQILTTYHPLLVVENNGCSRKFGYEPEALGKFLTLYGYSRIDVFDEDEIWRAE